MLLHLKHIKNVPKVLWYGTKGDYIFIVQNMLGVTLEEIKDKLKKDTIYKIGIALIEIIKDIHMNNILHRDISPSNIVYDINTNTISLIDFGLSKEVLEYNKYNEEKKNMQ